MKKNNLISESYRQANEKLHNSDSYGESNISLNQRMTQIIKYCHEKKLCQSVLDYGCGKGLLIRRLKALGI